MTKYLAILLCKRITELFKIDHTAVIAILAIAAILSGFGFLIGDTSNTNYSAINAFAPQYVWAIWFIIYGIEKIFEILLPIPEYIKAFNSLFGMWLWNYIILSFLFFDHNPTYPLEYTLISPLIIEVWFLTSLIYMVNTRKDKL